MKTKSVNLNAEIRRKKVCALKKEEQKLKAKGKRLNEMLKNQLRKEK